jgi:hypothetical protein
LAGDGGDHGDRAAEFLSELTFQFSVLDKDNVFHLHFAADECGINREIFPWKVISADFLCM